MARIANEEYELLDDPKFRTYVSAIDKALKNFESTSEWADLISALGKLNKVLISNIKQPVIPRRIIISKRLAQCMHPALPSGVHLKSLETYDIIFKCIGTARLGQELFIYSAGIFPLLSYAAMNVRRALLNLYDTHFLPLNIKLRPGLPGFLTGVLPGLEEGNEYYDRTNLLLEKVCEGVGLKYFYGCLWEAVLTNRNVRLPAMTYILSHFNRKFSIDDQLFIIGPNVDVMVEAACSAVQDISVLVQRITLDFLIAAFPMHLNNLVQMDVEKLLTSSVSVVLRRDMSLNRRLYTWLLGGDESNNLEKCGEADSRNKSDNDQEIDLNYFNKYSKLVLIKALRNCLKNKHIIAVNDHASLQLRPYRLLIALLDKPEIGSSILDDILVDIFRTLYWDCHVAQDDIVIPYKKKFEEKGQGELLKTANLLFGTFEPSYIWEFMAKQFYIACERRTSGDRTIEQRVQNIDGCKPFVSELCHITEFLLEFISVETYIEMQSVHLPRLLQNILKMLTVNCELVLFCEITCCLQLCSHLLSKIQPVIMSSNNIKLDSPTGRSSGPETPNVLNSKSLINASNVKAPQDCLNESTTVSSQNSSIECTVKATDSWIKTCVKAFLDFFMKLVSTHLFEANLDSQGLVQLLLIDQKEVNKSRQENVERLLHRALGYKSSHVPLNKNLPNYRILLDNLLINEVKLLPKSYELIDAFTLSCQILVDFSSFPAFYPSLSNYSRERESGHIHDNFHIPEWLRLLLVISCFVRQMEFQLVSISAILELMALTQTAFNAALELNEPEKGNGTVSVLIEPVLEVEHLDFLHNYTVFTPLVARILWEYLDKSHVSSLRRCVELLHQLHSLAIDGNIVEDVIGDSLAEDDEKMEVKAVQKFSMLWHLSRSLPSRTSPSGKIRLLDRSLLIMLSSLLKSFGPQRAEVTAWLNHSLQRGDIGLILEPLLLILLHADTARVSVQHVSIEKSEINTTWDNTAEANIQKDYESNVYAICSIEGRVIYHVNNRPSIGNAGENASSRQVFAVSSLVGEKDVVIGNSSFKDVDLPSYCERSVQEQISVFVNPFGLDARENSLSENSLLESRTVNLTKAHRIDVTALRMLSSFDDMESNTSCGSFEEPVNKSDNDNNFGQLHNPTEIVNSILSELIETAVKISEESHSAQEANVLASTYAPSNENIILPDATIHPLHNYLLLYTQCYDSGRVLYAFSILRAILQTNPRLVICTMATTGIGSSPRSMRQNQLYELLARHRKAIFGKHFRGQLTSEATTAYRSSMFLEIVMSLCLYFTRSFYPNLAHIKLTEEDLVNNWEVQLLSVDLLSIMLAEVAAVVKDSGKGFSSYINNLLEKCKVQKTILHCVLSGIFLLTRCESQGSTFSESIVRFNEACHPQKASDKSTNDQRWDYQETFQMTMLRLLLVLIILEHQLAKHTTENENENVNVKISNDKNQPSSIKYQPGQPISSQAIFQTAVITALKQPYTRSLHRHWLSLISYSLPFLRKSTSDIATMVVAQLCSNLEDLAVLYEDGSKISGKVASFSESQVSGHKIPVDHVILQLEGLMTLCHYCLLDNSNLVSTVLSCPMANVTQSNIMMTGSNATQIIGNLINVFTPAAQKDINSESLSGSKEINYLLAARQALLSQLPSIISSLATLWQSVNASETGNASQSAWIMGTPKVIKQLILELLSPICHHYGVNFLTAVSIAWNDRKSAHHNTRQIFPHSSSEQMSLVELVRALKVMPFETLVKLSRQVLKQQPIILHANVKLNIDVIMLQFFYSYVQSTQGNLLVEAWASFQGFIKDGLQMSTLSPPCIFLLFGVLNQYVQKAPTFDDKKERKELQDLVQRLIEVCGNIAGAALEQTTWLRRNLAVKPGPQTNDIALDQLSDTEAPIDSSSEPVKERPSTLIPNSLPNFSVQALFVMAEILATLLDVVYLSDEKEKVVPLLSNLMYNITPYLRNHSLHNAPSFLACSQLIANLSNYPYTRKAWRKDIFDLLMDSSFFMMKSGCLKWWRTIVDNLMTHDRTTFNDLMVRVSLIQSGGINLFTSREMEYEQRAQLLKRLSFVIFCSEIDQYQTFMPDIQERLSESMRLIQVPNVLTQVFLCFRVLLLRMSPQHITSLWPIIITEMVQVFIQIEQELCRNSEEFKSLPSSHLRRLSNLDSSWVTSSSNGLNAHSHPAWLQLYLGVCKLLDLALCLPTDLLPQFQIYSWAFVGKEDSVQLKSLEKSEAALSKSPSKVIESEIEFTPHVVRLARLMKKVGNPNRMKDGCARPLLTMRQISTINELQDFFEIVAANKYSIFLSSNNEKLADKFQEDSSNMKKSVERIIELDFLEPLANSNS